MGKLAQFVYVGYLAIGTDRCCYRYHGGSVGKFRTLHSLVWSVRDVDGQSGIGKEVACTQASATSSEHAVQVTGIQSILCIRSRRGLRLRYCAGTPCFLTSTGWDTEKQAIARSNGRPSYYDSASIATNLYQSGRTSIVSSIKYSVVRFSYVSVRCCVLS